MRFPLALFAVLLSASCGRAALILNPAAPITKEVTVQLIQVADDAGSNAAPLFGTFAQQSIIFDFVDQIWAQAGIDVAFKLRSGSYDNSFALTGSATTRPTGDLATLYNAAGAVGDVLDPDPTIINIFMVRIVPGFAQQSNNTANGIGFVDSNGIAFWAGPALTSFTAGQELLAAVLAHEIGHNLGLNHSVLAENLLLAGGSANPGQRLTAAQITNVSDSQFVNAISIPEPATTGWILICTTCAVWGLPKRKPTLTDFGR